MIFWEKMDALFKALEVVPPMPGTPFWECGTEVDAALKKVMALTEVAKAAHANQQHIAAMPWNIDDAYDPHSTCVDRGMFNNWCTGTSTQLDLALRELEEVKV